MKPLRTTGLLLFLLLTNSCIVQYNPNTFEKEELLVVEGLITDQPGINTIRLSKSLPLWKKQAAKPLKGCLVTISDDLGQIYNLKETKNGIYVTDSANFRGIIGREYSLHIRTTNDSINYSYSSLPMKMKFVPSIDSVYYEKKTFSQWPQPVEGCDIYLDTYDPANNCKFYRWEYTETWEFRLPYKVTNAVCWATNNSERIILKNTAVHRETNVIHYPLVSITNPIDRMSIKYSILVNQYSLNEDEYLYWERLKNSLDQVGGLYDQVPTTIPNNIFCVEDPGRIILGYFSVSAKSSKRIFIKDTFAGMSHLYYDCITDTIYGTDPIPDLDSLVWVIIDNSDKVPPTRIVTDKLGCADCRTRGTNIEPLFWKEGK